MRNYQTLSIIGGILNILIILAVWGLTAGLTGFVGTFNTNSTRQTQLESTAMQVSIQASLAILFSIAAMVLAFALGNRFKAIGISLIVLAVAVIIAGGYFGIVGFGLFLAAGIVALKYKSRPSMELTK